MITEQDLSPLKARIKEYITRHTRQFHHVYHSQFSSSSQSSGSSELHQTVWMLKRAQRINSDLWFVQRSLTDGKGVTQKQLQTQLLPKLEECLKELDSLSGLKREVIRTIRKAVEREVEREESNAKKREREQIPGMMKNRGRKIVSEVSMLVRNFLPLGLGGKGRF